MERWRGFKLGPSLVPAVRLRMHSGLFDRCSCGAINAVHSKAVGLRHYPCSMGLGGPAPQSSRPAGCIVARWTAGGCSAARGGRKLAAMAQAATFTPFRSSSFAGQRVVAKSSSVARSAVLRQPVQCRTLEAGAWPRPMLQGRGLPAAVRSP